MKKQIPQRTFIGFTLFCTLIGLTLAATATPPPPSPDNVANQLVATALTDQAGYQMLSDLCALGPRLCGSPNLEQAIHWAEQAMHDAGCDRVTLQPAMVPHWVRGSREELAITTPGPWQNQPLHVGALGRSVGTPEDGLTAGVIEVHSFDELKSKADAIKGRIVFYNVPFNQANLSTFKSYGEAVPYRFNGASAAAVYGARAVLIRSITTRYDNVPHVGVMSYKDDAAKIPAAAIALVDADTLSDALRADPNLQVHLVLSCRNLPDVQSWNVIGDMVGSDHPDDIVLVGGHIDSWDVGQGAHDDGAGCVQSLEVVDLFRRLHIRPRCTLRCVLFVSEEYGAQGARAFAASPAGHQHYLAVIESDRGGFTPRGFNVDGTPAVVARVAEWLPLLEKAGIDWVRPGGSGADVGRLKDAVARIGYVPDSQRYFDVHHSSNDVLTAVDPRELELGAASMAILSYLVSEEGIETAPVESKK